MGARYEVLAAEDSWQSLFQPRTSDANELGQRHPKEALFAFGWNGRREPSRIPQVPVPALAGAQTIMQFNRAQDGPGRFRCMNGQRPTVVRKP